MTLLPLAIGGIGLQEMLIILVILLVLFGGRKLPELARAMGTSITQFKKGLKEEDAEQIEGRTSGGAKADDKAHDKDGGSAS